MTDWFAPLIENPAPNRIGELGGFGIIALIATIVGWHIEQAFAGPKRTTAKPAIDPDPITALDPAHQQKVDALVEAASTIRNESRERDIDELSALRERNRLARLKYD